MPNIQEYNATGEITPSDKGIQAAEVAGRRYGQFGEQVAANIKEIDDRIDKHKALLETTALYTAASQAKIDLQKKFDETAATSPYNPHTADIFRAEEVEPVIERLTKGVSTDRGKELAATIGASLRTEMFNHTAAGQAAMDGNFVHTALGQGANALATDAYNNPTAKDRAVALGKWDSQVAAATANMTAEDAARTQEGYQRAGREQIVEQSYKGAADAIASQIEHSKDGTAEESPAYSQMGKDIAGDDFRYWPGGANKANDMREEAVRSGMERYKSRGTTARAQVELAGKATYARMDTALTDLIGSGQGPSPELYKARDQFAEQFGATNPGEVHAFNDALLRAQEDAQNHKFEPYNPKAWDGIPTGILNGTISDTTLLQMYGSHQITFKMMMDGKSMIKTVSNPAAKTALESFKRWQSDIIQAIPAGQPGSAQARAQFRHDSDASFMSMGNAQGDWNKALKMATDVHDPHSFGNSVAINRYRAAVPFHDAAAHLQSYPTDATHIPVFGSQARPIFHAAPTAGAPTKVDQKAVDALIWGK